jgi:hypothetical protein
VAGSWRGVGLQPGLLQLPEWNGDTNLEAEGSSSGGGRGTAAGASSDSPSGSDDQSRRTSPRPPPLLARAGSAFKPQPQVRVVQLQIPQVFQAITPHERAA